MRRLFSKSEYNAFSTIVMESQSDRLRAQVLVGLPHHHVFGNVWWRRGSTINIIIIHNVNSTTIVIFVAADSTKRISANVNEVHRLACLVNYDISMLWIRYALLIISCPSHTITIPCHLLARLATQEARLRDLLSTSGISDSFIAKETNAIERQHASRYIRSRVLFNTDRYQYEYSYHICPKNSYSVYCIALVN